MSKKPNSQAPDAVLSVNPVKFGKAILHWDAQANKSHNMDYELIPQSEPKAGQPLDILVLVKGKPVQGIKVGLGEDHPFNLTNEKGICTISPLKRAITKSGLNLTSRFKDNPDYNKRSVEYNANF